MLRADNYKNITERISKSKNINQDELNSIILDVFQDLKEHMSSFEELRYSVNGLFTFFYGKNRLERFSNHLAMIEDGRIDVEKTLYKTYIYQQDPVELRERLNKILNRYDGYIAAKKAHKSLAVVEK